MSGASDRAARLQDEGYDLLQEGRITRPHEQGLSFADRAEGCRVGLIRSGDKLLDDDAHWWHLREPGERQKP